MVARLFDDFIGLARDECLVDAAFACCDDGIRRDLVAGRKNGDIVPYKLGRVQHNGLPVPHGTAFRRGHDLQSIDLFLYPQILYNADEHVAEHRTKKCQVQPLPHGDHAARQQEEQKVKIGKNVFRNNLSNRCAGRFNRCIIPASVQPLLRLRSAQA